MFELVGYYINRQDRAGYYFLSFNNVLDGGDEPVDEPPRKRQSVCCGQVARGVALSPTLRRLKCVPGPNANKQYPTSASQLGLIQITHASELRT